MWLSIVSLVVLAGLAALAGAIRDRRLHRQPEAVSEAMPGVAGTEGCCGQHEVCEKESLLAAVSRKMLVRVGRSRPGTSRQREGRPGHAQVASRCQSERRVVESDSAMSIPAEWGRSAAS